MAAPAIAIQKTEYIATTALTVAGDSYPVEHKAWVYTDDNVSWELRRLFVSTFCERKELALSRILKTNAEVLSKYQGWLELLPIIPSRKSAVQTGIPVTPHTRDEFSCDSQNYLMLHLWIANDPP